MRFTSIGRSESSLKGASAKLDALMYVVAKEIKRVMSVSELAIRIVKRCITSDSLG